MKIGFTGHRNKTANPEMLINLLNEFPDAIWVHGGAKGFDAQVAAFANHHGVGQHVFLPEYNLHGKAAPLIRNRQIVAESDMLVACWDGRNQGGTYYTIGIAKKMSRPVKILSPV